MARHPRVLITGAEGQVGKALRPLLPDVVAASRHQLDVTNLHAVIAACEGKDVVIHLAANTYVDACEEDPEEADRVNSGGTRNVVEGARSAGARVVYLSTDFVFAGDASGEYSEDDATGPINAYGRSKLAGEHHMGPDDLIVRSSWIFGDGRNFITTILRLAASGPLEVVDDQCGRPTDAEALAQALVFLVNDGYAGTIHVAGEGEPASWADLADHALHAAGSNQELRRIDTRRYEENTRRRTAPRPANSTLSLDRARAMGVPLVDWRTSVTRYVEGLR